jgi:hypothetical protein
VIELAMPNIRKTSSSNTYYLLLLLLLQMLSFREHISVPAGVTDPVIKCDVSFTAEGGELARQTITINTGASAGRHVCFMRRGEVVRVTAITISNEWRGAI